MINHDKRVIYHIMLKLIVFLMILCMIVLQLVGCSSQLDDQRIIPMIGRLKPEDVIKVYITRNSQTLTDKGDITVFLAGIQSLKLKQKAKGYAPIYGSSYEISLNSSVTITLSFGDDKLCFGDDWYYYDETDNPIIKGSVQLFSQGKVYNPAKHCVFSTSYDGMCADGGRFGAEVVNCNEQLKTSIDQLAAIPYANDFNFVAVWEQEPKQHLTMLFDVFDVKLNKLSSDKDIPLIPGERGTYYVVTEQGWGTGYRCVGCQYIFKITR